MQEQLEEPLAVEPGDVTFEETTPLASDALAEAALAAPTEPLGEVAPTPVAPVVAPPVVAPALPGVDQQRLAQLEQENQRYQQQAQEAALQQQAQQYREQLIDQGWPDDYAKLYSEEVAQRAILQGQMQRMQATSESQAKETIAQRYAQQYGVPADSLMGYITPQAMEAAASREAAKDKEVNDLKAQVAQILRNQVPSQEFAGNQGGVPAGGSRAARVDALLSQLDWTDAELKEIEGL